MRRGTVQVQSGKANSGKSFQGAPVNRRFDLARMLPRLIVAAAQAGKRPEASLRLAVVYG